MRQKISIKTNIEQTAYLGIVSNVVAKNLKNIEVIVQYQTNVLKNGEKKIHIKEQNTINNFKEKLNYFKKLIKQEILVAVAWQI